MNPGRKLQILQALANGRSWGREIAAVLDLPLGTVYPTLIELCQEGLVRAEYESKEERYQRQLGFKQGVARRKYYYLTDDGVQELAVSAESEADKRITFIRGTPFTFTGDEIHWATIGSPAIGGAVTVGLDADTVLAMAGIITAERLMASGVDMNALTTGDLLKVAVLLGIEPEE